MPFVETMNEERGIIVANFQHDADRLDDAEHLDEGPGGEKAGDEDEAEVEAVHCKAWEKGDVYKNAGKIWPHAA